MGFFDRFRAKRDETAALYAALVARARQPHWYLDGAVADTVDGRFDMIAAVLAMVMLRLEADPTGVAAAAHLSEAFVDDMDPQLREIGIGDLLVGKHVGRMMGALGGRIGAFREARSTGDFAPAVNRNIFHEAPSSDQAAAWVAARIARIVGDLDSASLADLLAGKVPMP